jgi:Ca2+-binding RTX toxin-like protein
VATTSALNIVDDVNGFGIADLQGPSPREHAMATINQFFTDGADVFTAGNAADTYFLTFLNGIDRLTVQAGTVTASMGEGNDLITINGGFANVYGEGGADTFNLYADCHVHGGSGNDVFNLRAGSSGLTAAGDFGADRFNFLAAMSGVSLSGGEDNDLFFGNGYAISGNIYGDAGTDSFIGFRGAAATLRGGLGNDIYRLDPTSPASFVENIGEGIDTVQVAVGMSYTLGANLEDIVVQSFATVAGPAVLRGNALANRISGSNAVESLYGGQGNDVLDGSGGNDNLFGGLGNDTLIGGAGNDDMSGGTGNDIYYVDSAGDLITEASGGGTDLVLATVDYTLAPFVENATMIGGALELTGNDRDNVLIGGDGFDGLTGNAGNDTLDGGADRDFMVGGLGNDKYYVDNVDDLVAENPNEGIDTIYLNLVDHPVYDPAGPPQFPPTFVMDANVENLIVTQFGQVLLGHFMAGFVVGNPLANTISGSAGIDNISGAAGDDTISGKGGNDSLYGADGSDTLIGGSGDDVIIGDGNLVAAPSGDTLTGGAGADSYYYYDVAESAPFIFRADQITDFETGSDSIHLIVDANANVAGTQEWMLVSASSGAAGELWIDASDAGNQNYVVFGDNNGDGLADLMIQVHALTTFDASDIIL